MIDIYRAKRPPAQAGMAQRARCASHNPQSRNRLGFDITFGRNLHCSQVCKRTLLARSSFLKRRCMRGPFRLCSGTRAMSAFSKRGGERMASHVEQNWRLPLEGVPAFLEHMLHHSALLMRSVHACCIQSHTRVPELERLSPLLVSDRRF